MKRVVLWLPCLLLLSGCGSLTSIPYTPELSPEAWLDIQPYVDVGLGTWSFTLVQPSSTVFVYLLGVVAIAAGLHLRRIQDSQRSRRWWGIALLLWGAGALFAGTSYQAFSYEIKCAGRELCIWTSWWEVVYLLLSAASVDAMMVAQAFSCSGGRLRRGMISYAAANIALYTAVVLVGTFVPVRFLISFELLLLVTAPSVVFFLVLNGWRYSRFRDRMDLALLGTWIWLGVTIGAYFLYLVLDITHDLWARGIWFSENDVLHIGLIGWMAYIGMFAAKRVADAPDDVGLVSGAGN